MHLALSFSRILNLFKWVKWLLWSVAVMYNNSFRMFYVHVHVHSAYRVLSRGMRRSFYFNTSIYPYNCAERSTWLTSLKWWWNYFAWDRERHDIRSTNILFRYARNPATAFGGTCNWRICNWCDCISASYELHALYL